MRLGEILEMCRAATPGPWTVYPDDVHEILASAVDVVGVYEWEVGRVVDPDRDAAFICMAREELPRLAKVLQKISAVGHIFCSAFPGPCPKECDMRGVCEIEEIANAFIEAGITE